MAWQAVDGSIRVSGVVSGAFREDVSLLRAKSREASCAQIRHLPSAAGAFWNPGWGAFQYHKSMVGPHCLTSSHPVWPQALNLDMLLIPSIAILTFWFEVLMAILAVIGLRRVLRGREERAKSRSGEG